MSDKLGFIHVEFEELSVRELQMIVDKGRRIDATIRDYVQDAEIIGRPGRWLIDILIDDHKRLLKENALLREQLKAARDE